MSNMFVNARDRNIEEGTMTKGKEDSGRPASLQVIQEKSDGHTPHQPFQCYEVSIGDRRACVQAKSNEIEELRAFLSDYVTGVSIRRLSFVEIEALKAGAMMFSSQQPKPAPKPKAPRKRKTQRPPAQSNLV